MIWPIGWLDGGKIKTPVFVLQRSEMVKKKEFGGGPTSVSGVRGKLYCMGMISYIAILDLFFNPFMQSCGACAVWQGGIFHSQNLRLKISCSHLREVICELIHSCHLFCLKILQIKSQ